MTSVATGVRHVPWSRAANIYQVNLRQYTPEGTFNAFAAHLPRLRALGVDILWLMPIHPIGEKNRKGTLGSGYSVRDYLAVNPEFGSLDDFKRLVDVVHRHGMRLLIDWVANHTAWDHPWLTQHPEWYRKNAAGEIVSYHFDNGKEVEYWTDVVGLDYSQPALCDAMVDALVWWLRETDIDGYRCDVAGLLPTAFWERARAALDAVKPVFMLAEWSEPELHRHAFDMTYDWALYDTLSDIAAGRARAAALADWWTQRQALYPKHALRMLFTSNHDKNSWVGHDAERFGDGFEAFAVLAATLPGVPLVYGGQEAVLDRRLAFFEKDTVDWKSFGRSGFYADLLKLKHDHPALWNGEDGADLTLLPQPSPDVLAFVRARDGDHITVAVNLSGRPQPVALGDAAATTLPAWGWQVSARQQLGHRAVPAARADAAPSACAPTQKPAPSPAAEDDRHRPPFHFTAPSGWINDPNGVCWHDGRWHVFYQHNPDAPRWGGICWGHASSADLCDWHDEPIALRPTPGDDQGGCFSGSFALVNGVPTLYYTGDNGRHQVQCAATGSADLRHWTKHPERSIATPPPGVPAGEFRDPFVFRHGSAWYQVVGASDDSERGQCLLYRSDDGVAWHYLHPLYTAPRLDQGIVWECPNFFPLGGRWVLTVSLWPNLGALWFVGRFEGERFVAESEGVHDVDGGAFAHLAARAPDGRMLQWAWINEQRGSAQIDAAGWAGALTVPRVLWLDARSRLNVWPVAEVATLRRAAVDAMATGADCGERFRFAGEVLDIEADIRLLERRKVGLAVRASADGREATRIVYWPEARRLVVERGQSSLDPDARRQDVSAALLLDADEPLRLRVLLDRSVLEVYANGRLALATRIYPTLADSVHGALFTEGRADAALRLWTMDGIHRGRAGSSGDV